MDICHLVSRSDSLTYTVAKALTHGGHDVYVWEALPPERSQPVSKIRERLVNIPGVKITSGRDDIVPAQYNRLIIQIFPRLMEHAHVIGPLASRARRITVVTAGDRSHPWRTALRLQRRELGVLLPWLHRVERIGYKDGFYAFDLYALFKSRRVVGFDIHSQFLHDAQAFAAIHAPDWDVEAQRRYLANFLGSQDPKARKLVLDAVRPFFSGSGSGSIARLSFWHEYSDAVPNGMEWPRFLGVLSDSNFTLCPPGYSLVTHRPMEALLRGSIPVLHENELDLYGIGLVDGVNAIAVLPGQWAATMERLAGLPEDRVIAMRKNIWSLVESHIHYEACSRRMRSRLGMEDDL
jgi:hypothetical protein